MDLTNTIIPRSDQINAEDLLAGPRTVTIRDVTPGNQDQPVNVATDEFGTGRPYKPSKSMRRVMVAAWGPDSTAYIGRRMVLYRDPSIRFGGQEVGGIRISHLSDLKNGQPLTVALTVTRGKRVAFKVEPIAAAPVHQPADRAHKAIAAFDAFGITPDQLEARVGAPVTSWTAENIAALLTDYQALKRGELTSDDFVGGFDEATDEPEPDDFEVRS